MDRSPLLRATVPAPEPVYAPVRVTLEPPVRLIVAPADASKVPPEYPLPPLKLTVPARASRIPPPKSAAVTVTDDADVNRARAVYRRVQDRGAVRRPVDAVNVDHRPGRVFDRAAIESADVVSAVLNCERAQVVERAAESRTALVRGVDHDIAKVGQRAGGRRELTAADPIEKPAGKVKPRTAGADDEIVAVEHEMATTRAGIRPCERVAVTPAGVVLSGRAARRLEVPPVLTDPLPFQGIRVPAWASTRPPVMFKLAIETDDGLLALIIP